MDHILGLYHLQVKLNNQFLSALFNRPAKECFANLRKAKGVVEDWLTIKQILFSSKAFSISLTQFWRHQLLTNMFSFFSFQTFFSSSQIFGSQRNSDEQRFGSLSKSVRRERETFYLFFEPLTFLRFRQKFIWSYISFVFFRNEKTIGKKYVG